MRKTMLDYPTGREHILRAPLQHRTLNPCVIFVSFWPISHCDPPSYCDNDGSLWTFGSCYPKAAQGLNHCATVFQLECCFCVSHLLKYTAQYLHKGIFLPIDSDKVICLWSKRFNSFSQEKPQSCWHGCHFCLSDTSSFRLPSNFCLNIASCLQGWSDPIASLLFFHTGAPSLLPLQDMCISTTRYVVLWSYANLVQKYMQ